MAETNQPVDGDARTPDRESPATAQPTDLIEEQLSALWCELLEIPALATRENVFDAGATSLDVARAAARIKKRFGRELRLKVLMEAPTVAQLAEVLRREPDLQSPVVVPLRIYGSRPPLFLLPGAAGHLVALRDLWLRLPVDQPVYGIEPKLVSEEYGGAATGAAGGPRVSPPRVEDIAAAYVKDISEVQPEGPYFIVGLCFGGLVAFEMARLLLARGEMIGFLALLDPPLPGSRQTPFRLSDVAEITGRFLRKDRAQRADIARRFVGGLLERSRARWQTLVMRLSPRGLGAPDRLERRVLNFAATMQFAPQPLLGQPYALFLAIDNGPRQNKYQEVVWKELGPGGVTVDMVPGGHGTFFREPHVATLVETLLARLETAQAKGGAVRASA